MKYISINICGKTISWAVFEKDSYEIIGSGNIVVQSVNAKISVMTDKLEGIILDQEKIHGEIANVAISLPGAVDRFTGVLVQRARWLDQLVANSVLKEKFSLKNKNFHFVNDASAALIGNSQVGISKDYDSAVYFICGTGVGASVKINGKLYEGKNNITGEIGKVLSHGTTIETMLSLTTMIAQASIVSGEEIEDHHKLYEVSKTNESVKEFLDEWYKRFIESLENIIWFYDPELIIIQSEIYELECFNEKDIKKDLVERLGDHIPYNVQVSSIKVGEESINMSLIGAVVSMKEVEDSRK